MSIKDERLTCIIRWYEMEKNLKEYDVNSDFFVFVRNRRFSKGKVRYLTGIGLSSVLDLYEDLTTGRGPLCSILHGFRTPNKKI